MSSSHNYHRSSNEPACARIIEYENLPHAKGMVVLIIGFGEAEISLHRMTPEEVVTLGEVIASLGYGLTQTPPCDHSMRCTCEACQLAAQTRLSFEGVPF